MEVYAINRLALLFGTTWLVSAVSIAAMLVEIVAANLVVSALRIDLRPYAYGGARDPAGGRLVHRAGYRASARE